MEVKQRCVIKLRVEEGIKRVEIIDWMNKYYSGMSVSGRKCTTGSRR
jgi:hypothetical protein